MTRYTAILLALLFALSLVPMGCPGADDDDSDEPPLGVMVTPEEPVVTVGGTTQLVATAFYDSGETADVTAASTWSVTGGSAIEVSNQLDAEGVATGLSEGTASVTATYMELTSDAVVVRVTEADVVGLSVSPTEMELEVGGSGFFTAMADFSDGTRGDMSGSVRWVTADPSVVTIASDGKATGAGVGSTTVRAEYEDVASDPATVTVTGGSGDDDDDDDASDDDTSLPDDDDSLPDLAVTYFAVYVDHDNDVTYYYVDVSNLGASTSEMFFVELFVDAYSTPTLMQDGDETLIIEGLDSSDTKYADFEVYDVPFYYEWWSYVVVDSWDDVAESDESDNIVGPLVVY